MNQYMNSSENKFLVVGGAKCATTALFYYITQHPDVYVPKIKECRFFSNIGNRVHSPFTQEAVVDITRSWDEYQSLFKDVPEKFKGDVSPDYLYYYHESINNITTMLGTDVKVIIMLRDPIERAFSNYWHLRREKLTELSFDNYIRVEDDFYEPDTWWGFFMKKPSIYSEAIAAYIQAFPSVKLVYFEDFVVNPVKVSFEILNFIGTTGAVDLKSPSFTNKSGKDRLAWLSFLIKNEWRGKRGIMKFAQFFIGEAKLHDLLISTLEKNYEQQTMSSEARNYLEEYYFHDTLKIESTLGKEVPWTWVQKKKKLLGGDIFPRNIDL